MWAEKWTIMQELFKNHQIHFKMSSVCKMKTNLHRSLCVKAVMEREWNIGQSSDAFTLRWRHNDRDGVSNHQPHDCLLNRLFRRRSKKTSKLRVTGLCAGNSPGTGEFPAQMASYAENVFIWWRHHAVWALWKLRPILADIYDYICQIRNLTAPNNA